MTSSSPAKPGAKASFANLAPVHHTNDAVQRLGTPLTAQTMAQAGVCSLEEVLEGRSAPQQAICTAMAVMHCSAAGTTLDSRQGSSGTCKPEWQAEEGSKDTAC